MSKSFALLTKTFHQDLSVFERLCDSIDEHNPDLTHYVVIDKSDEAVFARFASDRRILLRADKLLPEFLELNLPGRRIWYRPPFHLVRGWIYQQLAKMQAVSGLKEDAVVLIDSDVLLMRSIQHDHVFDGDRVKLYHAPDKPSGPASESDKWHDVASQALGLPATGYTGADYISGVIAWSPKVVRAMLLEIEEAGDTSWVKRLIGNFRISEYVIYGVFCSQCDGEHQQLVAPTLYPLSLSSWLFDLTDPEGVEQYINAFQPYHVAGHIQSNLHLDDTVRDDIFARLRNRDGVMNSTSAI